MRFKSPRGAHPQDESERRSLHQFIKILQDTTDSPTLIQKIAENRKFFIYCAAIINPEGQFPLPFNTGYILQLLRSHHIDPDRLASRLEPIAHALGITPGEALQADYYKTLGISQNAGPEEIKSAYREKARETHPDTQNGDNRHFLAISEAYQVLSDKSRRRQYDVSLKNAENRAWSETPFPEPRSPRSIFSNPSTVMLVLFIGCFFVLATLITDHMVHELSLRTKEPVVTNNKQQLATDQPEQRANTESGSEIVSDNKGAEKNKTDKISEEKEEASKNTTQHQEVKQLENIDTFVDFAKEIKAMPVKSTKTPIKKNLQANKTLAPLAEQTTTQPYLKDVLKPKLDSAVHGIYPEADAKKVRGEIIHSTPVPERKLQEDQAASLSRKKYVAKGTQGESEEIISSTGTATISSDTMIKRVDAFVKRYVKTYEEKNTENFLRLFTVNATENGKPISQMKPLYQKNFQSLETIKYMLRVKNYAWDIASNKMLVSGNFALDWRKKGASTSQSYHGLIKMTLVSHPPDTFQVERLSYEFVK